MLQGSSSRPLQTEAELRPRFIFNIKEQGRSFALSSLTSNTPHNQQLRHWGGLRALAASEGVLGKDSTVVTQTRVGRCRERGEGRRCIASKPSFWRGDSLEGARQLGRGPGSTWLPPGTGSAAGKPGANSQVPAGTTPCLQRWGRLTSFRHFSSNKEGPDFQRKPPTIPKAVSKAPTSERTSSGLRRAPGPASEQPGRLGRFILGLLFRQGSATGQRH